jgi:hypothetical protein
MYLGDQAGGLAARQRVRSRCCGRWGHHAAAAQRPPMNTASTIRIAIRWAASWTVRAGVVQISPTIEVFPLRGHQAPVGHCNPSRGSCHGRRAREEVNSCAEWDLWTSATHPRPPPACCVWGRLSAWGVLVPPAPDRRGAKRLALGAGGSGVADGPETPQGRRKVEPWRRSLAVAGGSRATRSSAPRRRR